MKSFILAHREWPGKQVLVVGEPLLQQVLNTGVEYAKRCRG
jgi:hypothetical protein